MKKIFSIIAAASVIFPLAANAYTLNDITSGQVLHIATSTGSSAFTFALNNNTISVDCGPAGDGFTAKTAKQTMKSQLFNFSVAGAVQAIWFRGSITNQESIEVSNIGVDLVEGGGQNLGGTEQVFASGTLAWSTDIGEPFVVFNNPYTITNTETQYRIKLSLKGSGNSHTIGVDATDHNTEIYYCSDIFNTHDIVLMFNAYGAPASFTSLISPTISTSTPVLGIDCTGIQGSIQQDLCKITAQTFEVLFIPSASSTDALLTLWDLIKNKPPIGYFYLVQTAIGELSTDTPPVSLPDLSAIEGIMSPMYDGITLLLWLLFVLWLFYRIKHLEL